MLEFFCDAHTHLISGDEECALLCALNKEEWMAQTPLIEERRTNVFPSFGVHPLKPDEAGLSFLQHLLQEGLLDAVGEAGFDFGAKGTRANDDFVAAQEALWQAQEGLAVQYGKPLVVHCVKALDRLFPDKELRRAKAVIFHAFSGSGADAASLLRHGINAYFSFGKGLLKNGRAAECAKAIPMERLLLETDNVGSVHQKQSGGSASSPACLDIKAVYSAAASLRCVSMDEMCAAVKCNFLAALA